MKQYIKVIPIITMSLLSSCADNELLEFSVEKPASIAEYEYLNTYHVLKDYVDRTANPDFKLGIGVSVGDYNAKGGIYQLINSNFDEMTAGWEMKHGACVSDEGAMDFSTVEKFIATAKSAGTTIYGHTLCWHANQNAKWLNSTIAPSEAGGDPYWEDNVFINSDFEGDDESSYTTGTSLASLSYTANGGGADGIGRAIAVTNSAVRTNDYESQFFFTFPSMHLVEGETYEFSMKYRADQACSFATQAHYGPQEYKHWDMFGSLSATTSWKTYKKEFTATADVADAYTFAFNLGATATTYYFDDISLRHYNKGSSGTSWVEQLSGGDFEEDNFDNSFQVNGVGVKGYATGSNGLGRALTVKTPSAQVNDYESQFIFKFSPTMKLGDVYKVSMDIKADKAMTFSTQTQTTPGSYLHWTAFGDISASTEWKTFTYTLTVTDSFVGGGAIAFNLGKNAGTVYIDNLSFQKETATGGEKTDEEKKEIITNEMERWIKGMMEVTKDYVKVWDVVNEPMDDGNPSQLKTGVGKSDIGADEFYWQDYMGKDYARKAVELARKYGGDDQKLFINDYNLEYSLDKCNGLINMVKYWESDGVTKIDGIGTQMHVSVSLDAAEQVRREARVDKMFEALAATGKLIKISELDMGIDDESGNSVKTKDATFEQLKKQSDYYTYIIKSYFKYIPAPQRYGITQWASTDSPDNSSWRPRAPIGLWNSEYYRKPAYGGFADGLSK